LVVNCDAFKSEGIMGVKFSLLKILF